MNLSKALDISRLFYYDGKKFFVMIYPKYKAEAFWVYCSYHPNPDKVYKIMSDVDVKPIIRISNID